MLHDHGISTISVRIHPLAIVYGLAAIKGHTDVNVMHLEQLYISWREQCAISLHGEAEVQLRKALYNVLDAMIVLLWREEHGFATVKNDLHKSFVSCQTRLRTQ